MDELTIKLTHIDGLVLHGFIQGVVKEMKDVAKVSEWESEEVQLVVKALTRLIEQLPIN